LTYLEIKQGIKASRALELLFNGRLPEVVK
jgi:hypothetical protein